MSTVCPTKNGSGNWTVTVDEVPCVLYKYKNRAKWGWLRHSARRNAIFNSRECMFDSPEQACADLLRHFEANPEFIYYFTLHEDFDQEMLDDAYDERCGKEPKKIILHTRRYRDAIIYFNSRRQS